jgi:hypothetical protein
MDVQSRTGGRRGASDQGGEPAVRHGDNDRLDKAAAPVPGTTSGVTDAHRRRRPSGASEQRTLETEVVAGPSGAMTRDGGTLTGRMTVTTTSSPLGRTAQVTVRPAGSETAHVLAGSPFQVPPEGIEALHAIVIAAIAAGAEDD